MTTQPYDYHLVVCLRTVNTSTEKLAGRTNTQGIRTRDISTVETISWIFTVLSTVSWVTLPKLVARIVVRKEAMIPAAVTIRGK